MHQGVRPIRRRPPTGFGLGRDKSGKRSIHGYVSIYRRPVLHSNLKIQMRIPQSGATKPLSFRWGFETASKLFEQDKTHPGDVSNQG
jgi:hypothetical protein